jgi:hypothetical protein
VLLDLLPNQLQPITEKLLGKGMVHPATGEDVGTMLGLPNDETFPAELKRVADSSDVGIGPLCARFLPVVSSIGSPLHPLSLHVSLCSDSVPLLGVQAIYGALTGHGARMRVRSSVCRVWCADRCTLIRGMTQFVHWSRFRRCWLPWSPRLVQ